MSEIDTDVLTQLVARKLDCLAQLRALGQRQIELVGAGDLTQLLRVLSGKQRLLGKLQAIEAALAPFRDQDPETRVWRSAEDRQRCARMAELCAALLSEIMQHEKQSEAALVRRRDEAATQLQGMHDAEHVQHAYLGERPEGTGEHLHFNLES